MGWSRVSPKAVLFYHNKVFHFLIWTYAVFASGKFAFMEYFCALWGFVAWCCECDFIITISQNVEKWIDVEKIVSNINQSDENENCNKHTKHADKLNLIGEWKKDKKRKVVKKLFIGAVCGTFNLNNLSMAFNLFHCTNKPQDSKSRKQNQKSKCHWIENIKRQIAKRNINNKF